MMIARSYFKAKPVVPNSRTAIAWLLIFEIYSFREHKSFTYISKQIIGGIWLNSTYSNLQSS